MTARELETRITDLEEKTWQALQQSGEGLAPFVSKDCVMQFPLGMKITPTSRPSVQDILHSEAFIPWKSYELSKIDVTPAGEGGAVISYLARATRPAVKEGDVDAEFEALCCSVWRWNGEKYEMCFHQQTLTNAA